MSKSTTETVAIITAVLVGNLAGHTIFHKMAGRKARKAELKTPEAWDVTAFFPVIQ